MPGNAETFMRLYSAIREKEGRVYSDEELKYLPQVPKTHQHQLEWKLRQKSSRLLFNYLKNKKKPLHILEVGCGNGWLSHLLAQLPGSTLLGIDPGESEISQAQRVFVSQPNLSFKTMNFEPNFFLKQQFDIILFAASIQYFKSLSTTLNFALTLLRSEGEIHLIDSPFYKESDLIKSEQNSENHFKQLGYADMKYYYFRHSALELKAFRHKLFYRPNPLLLKLGLQTLPFPWICIPKS